METLKMLKTKSEITVKNLKSGNCDYKGHRLAFEDGYYIIGSHHNPSVNYYETIEDLKLCL